MTTIQSLERSKKLSTEVTFSVILATFNGERFLQNQLDSISSQIRRPIQLIVCDDGSVDETLIIVKQFAELVPFSVKVLQSPGHRLGYAENFLRGIVHCNGSYIAFSDQDDVWLPDKLQIVADLIRQSNADAVVHDGDVVNRELQRIGRRFPNIKVKSKRMNKLPRLFLCPGFALTIRRELIASFTEKVRPKTWIGDLTTDLPHDLWTYFIARNVGLVAHTPQSLVNYRQHTSNLCGAGEEKGVKRIVTLALSARSETYQHQAGCCREYSEFLRTQCGHLGKEYQMRAVGSAQWFDRRASALENRQKQYSVTSKMMRLSIFLQSVLKLHYQSKGRGGLGIQSFLKDTYFLMAKS